MARSGSSSPSGLSLCDSISTFLSKSSLQCSASLARASSVDSSSSELSSASIKVVSVTLLSSSDFTFSFAVSSPELSASTLKRGLLSVVPLALSPRLALFSFSCMSFTFLPI